MMNALVVTDNSPWHWSRYQLFIYLFFNVEFCVPFEMLVFVFPSSRWKKCKFGLTCIRCKSSYRYLAKDKWNFRAWYFFAFSVNLQCNHRCKCLFWHHFICGCISIIFAFVCHYYWLHAFGCLQLNAKRCCSCCCCWFVSNIQSIYIQNAKISKSKIETQTKCWSKSRWAALNLKAVFYTFSYIFECWRA